jgi:hypothetical protein
MNPPINQQENINTNNEKNGKNKNVTVTDIKQSSERVKRRGNSENKIKKQEMKDNKK